MISKKENQRPVLKYSRMVPISIFLVIVLLMVSVFPGKNQVVFTVYASEGEKVELNDDAVKIHEKLCFESSGLRHDNGVAEVVYVFDITCEGEGVKTITYIIEGEETVVSRKEINKNQVWFAEIVDGAYDNEESKYPFTYRSYGDQDEYQTYIYLGSQYSVEADKQKNKKYCIEYRVQRMEDRSYEAEPFDIRVEIEKEDGDVIERKLHFEPEFNVVNGVGGTELVEELWVSER